MFELRTSNATDIGSDLDRRLVVTTADRPFFLMANPSRRVPPPSQQEYYAVPQSPRSVGHGPMQSITQPYSPTQPYNSQPYGPRPPIRSRSTGSTQVPPNSRGHVTQGVATGAIGGAYGPYSVSFLSMVSTNAIEPCIRSIIRSMIVFTIPHDSASLLLQKRL